MAWRSQFLLGETRASRRLVPRRAQTCRPQLTMDRGRRCAACGQVVGGASPCRNDHARCLNIKTLLSGGSTRTRKIDGIHLWLGIRTVLSITALAGAERSKRRFLTFVDGF